MKRVIFLILFVAVYEVSSAQNTFPADGDVHIGSDSLNRNLNVFGITNLTGQTRIDVGRGEVRVENNVYDNADGSGITLRTLSNPNNGSIFSVRSLGQANRFWVGQNFTSSGGNDFYVGSADLLQANDPSLYSSKIAASGVSYFTAGNVGVGTKTPTDLLQLEKSDDKDIGLSIVNSNLGNLSRATMKLNNGNGIGALILTGNNYSSYGWKNKLVLNTDTGINGGILVRPSGGGFQVSANGANNPNLYVSQDGNVGINNSSPNFSLDVSGEARYSSALNLSHVSSGLFMDSPGFSGKGIKKITWNDGGGNFNIRAGSYFSGVDRYELDGQSAVSTVFNFESSTSSLEWKVANAGTAGERIYWDKAMILNSTGLGIGKNPMEALDLAGNIKSDGRLVLYGGTSGIYLDEIGVSGLGIKKVTWNDGGGNFIMRGGSYYQGFEKYEKDNYGATLIAQNFEGVDGYIDFKVGNKGLAGSQISYSNSLRISTNGVAIGTNYIPSEFKLVVAGKMLTERVVVRKQENWNWPDFVFAENYQLPELSDVEAFIDANNHLPEIPSAKEIQENGQDIGEMNRLLLQKVEELTLYMIEQNKELQNQKKALYKQQREISHLKKNTEK